jgi:mannose/fructose/N-acetylgalactosamine-specific phosphotransferase system component IID
MKRGAKRAKVGNKNKTGYPVLQGAIVGAVLFVLSLIARRWVSVTLFLALALPLLVARGFWTTYKEDFTPKGLRTMLATIVVLHVPLIVAIYTYSLVLEKMQWMFIVGSEMVLMVLLTVIFGNQGILQSLVAPKGE